jgi:regulatory protein
LARRDYTTAELRAKLGDRGCDAGDIQATIDRLGADGLLDDRRVAAAHLRTASRIKGRGAHRIGRELVARGIDRSLAAELVAGLSVQDEVAAIDRLLLRRPLPSQPTLADRRRLYQHLLRRGFSTDAIAAALKARGDGVDE